MIQAIWEFYVYNVIGPVMYVAVFHPLETCLVAFGAMGFAIARP
jgi:hypothetical protein